MKLDIRVPIGTMFTLIGVLLFGYGLAFEHSTIAGAGSSNIDVWWGGLMILFGVAMLGLARRARR